MGIRKYLRPRNACAALMIILTIGTFETAASCNELNADPSKAHWVMQLKNACSTLQKKPSDCAALLAKSEALIGLSQFRESIAVARVAVKNYPKKSSPHSALARGHYYLSQLPEALREANLAIALNSENWDAFDIRSAIYGKLHRFKESLADSERSKEIQMYHDMGAR